LLAAVTAQKPLTHQNHWGRCRQHVQALIEALILQAHERLQQGQPAQDVFAHLFAKQQVIAVA
jgi:hypothetical protein